MPPVIELVQVDQDHELWRAALAGEPIDVAANRLGISQSEALRRTRQLAQEHAEILQHAARGEAALIYARLNELYSQAMAADDLRGALEVLKIQASLVSRGGVVESDSTASRRLLPSPEDVASMSPEDRRIALQELED